MAWSLWAAQPRVVKPAEGTPLAHAPQQQVPAAGLPGRGRRVPGWPQAVRWRLTLWYGATLAVILSVAAGASLVVLARVLEARGDRFLLEAGRAFIAVLVGEAAEHPGTQDAVRAALDEIRFDETRCLVYAPGGRLVAATVPPAAGAAGGAPLRPDDARRLVALVRVPSRPDDAPRLATIDDGEGGIRVALVPVTLHGGRHTVAVVRSRHGMRETVEGVAAGYAVAVPVLLVLAGAGGYVLAGRALAPVAAMSRRAAAISASTLHERLPVANPRDELGELAGVVNALLGRLEAAFAQQRRFVADASHELRTPVAILRAEADVALARDGRVEAEYRDALRVVRDAGQRLSRIVDDLFLLARVDAGHRRARLQALYLDELVADGARAMRAVAGERQVRIDVALSGDAATGAPFVGDPELLDRLLFNLLDNAVRFSPYGGRVQVRLARDAAAYRLAVADEGSGIPPDAQPHVFERFFRVDPARTAGMLVRGAPAGHHASGAGLGLAIARWVAESHGGTLTLAHSTPAGSEFLATLPIPPDGPRRTEQPPP